MNALCCSLLELSEQFRNLFFIVLYFWGKVDDKKDEDVVTVLLDPPAPEGIHLVLLN